MRPDVASALDRLARAARRAGLALVISSAYRSDVEQARLFARNPDPRWVAPPGRSLHRCATELDLGPPQAYRWLAVNAARFGFVRRYAWEPCPVFARTSNARAGGRISLRSLTQRRARLRAGRSAGARTTRSPSIITGSA